MAFFDGGEDIGAGPFGREGSETFKGEKSRRIRRKVETVEIYVIFEVFTKTDFKDWGLILAQYRF